MNVQIYKEATVFLLHPFSSFQGNAIGGLPKKLLIPPSFSQCKQWNSLHSQTVASVVLQNVQEKKSTPH